MSVFDRYRHDPAVYRHLLQTDPYRHPWRRWGLTPQQIAHEQRVERARVAQAPRMRGAGDVVARMTGAVGIKPCAPCKRRQAAMNRWWPFS